MYPDPETVEKCETPRKKCETPRKKIKIKRRVMAGGCERSVDSETGNSTGQTPFQTAFYPESAPQPPPPPPPYTSTPWNPLAGVGFVYPGVSFPPTSPVLNRIEEAYRDSSIHVTPVVMQPGSRSNSVFRTELKDGTRQEIGSNLDKRYNSSISDETMVKQSGLRNGTPQEVGLGLEKGYKSSIPEETMVKQTGTCSIPESQGCEKNEVSQEIDSSLVGRRDTDSVQSLRWVFSGRSERSPAVQVVKLVGGVLGALRTET